MTSRPIMSSDDIDHEIHFIKTHGIMEWDEIMKLNDDRKTLNHKIAHGLATRDEVLKQIKVELNMLDACQLKIDQEMKGNDTGDINTEVLTVLSNRINDMYINVFEHFPVEKTSLLEYFDLCSNNKLFITKSSKMLDTLMSKYHSDPDVYITAAKYEFDDRNDTEKARKYFSEGLKHHKDCKSLYEEEFWVEIQNLEKIAIGKYRNLIERFEGDMEFHFTLLDKAIKLRTVGELQCYVVRDMVKKYRLSELMWQKLAKIHFDGFIYDHDTEQLHYDKDNISGIRNCIKTYEDGLKENLSLDSEYNLWNFYIDDVIEIRKSNHMQNETIKNFMNEKMEKAFQEAHDNGALRTEEHYIYWVENTKKDIHTILKSAVHVMNESVELWIQLLSFYIDNDYFEMAIDTFQSGVQNLTNKSMPLWEIMILYMHNTNPQLLKNLYEEGARYPYKEINSVIRIQYLEWWLLHKGMHGARKLFKELKDMDPPIKELYSAMIKFERRQCSSPTQIGTIRKLYSDMCKKFGQNDIGVWLDCIRFESTVGDRKFVEHLYSSSLSILDPSLAKDMPVEFEKLKEELKEDDPDDAIVYLIDDDDE